MNKQNHLDNIKLAELTFHNALKFFEKSLGDYADFICQKYMEKYPTWKVIYDFSMGYGYFEIKKRNKTYVVYKDGDVRILIGPEPTTLKESLKLSNTTKYFRDSRKDIFNDMYDFYKLAEKYSADNTISQIAPENQLTKF